MLTQEELDILDDWVYDDERLVWYNQEHGYTFSGETTLKEIVLRAITFGE